MVPLRPPPPSYLSLLPSLCRARAICLAQLGGEHPNTLVVTSNLAACMTGLGRHEEAEALYRVVGGLAGVPYTPYTSVRQYIHPGDVRAASAWVTHFKEPSSHKCFGGGGPCQSIKCGCPRCPPPHPARHLPCWPRGPPQPVPPSPVPPTQMVEPAIAEGVSHQWLDMQSAAGKATSHHRACNAAIGWYPLPPSPPRWWTLSSGRRARATRTSEPPSTTWPTASRCGLLNSCMAGGRSRCGRQSREGLAAATAARSRSVSTRRVDRPALPQALPWWWW